jgi:hypothetical protein
LTRYCAQSDPSVMVTELGIALVPMRNPTVRKVRHRVLIFRWSKNFQAATWLAAASGMFDPGLDPANQGAVCAAVNDSGVRWPSIEALRRSAGASTKA